MVTDIFCRWWRILYTTYSTSTFPSRPIRQINPYSSSDIVWRADIFGSRRKRIFSRLAIVYYATQGWIMQNQTRKFTLCQQMVDFREMKTQRESLCGSYRAKSEWRARPTRYERVANARKEGFEIFSLFWIVKCVLKAYARRNRPLEWTNTYY